MWGEEHAERIASLEAELAAARETIAVLKRTVEQHQRHHGVDQFAVQKAMTNLEGTIDRRTQELRQSEERYRALFDHSPSMALTVDDAGTITDVNESAQSSLGELRSPLRGCPLEELFAEASRVAVRRLLHRSSGTEHELALADGRKVDATVAKVPGHPDGQVLLHDITEWLELHREVQHTRRLAAIGRLAAGVAHEINNPLAVLHLAMQRLAQASADERPAAVAELLDHADRIARIVENLQSFASPRPPEPERLGIGELVASARDIAEPSLRGMAISAQVTPAELSCFVDRGQLEQVLVNLLTNAARATAGAGTVRITARGDSDWVTIQVADDGPGIPSHLLEDIFTPFVTGEASKRAGMGLGLSITWGLVRENGGTVSAHNAPAGGACFELRLPGVSSDQRRGTPRSSRRPTRPGSDHPRPGVEEGRQPIGGEARPLRRVLCVDDEPALREMMVLLLEADGYEAQGVGTAEEALALLDEASFDCVISDLRLPGLSGRDLAARAVARRPGLRGRIVLMSGLFSDSKRDGPYLQKPFTEERLLGLLAELAEAPAR